MGQITACLAQQVGPVGHLLPGHEECPPASLFDNFSSFLHPFLESTVLHLIFLWVFLEREMKLVRRHIVTGHLTVSVLRKKLRDVEGMLLLRKGGLEGAGQVQISIVSSTIPL